MTPTMDIADAAPGTGGGSEYSSPSGSDQEMSSLLGEGFDAAQGEDSQAPSEPSSDSVIDPSQDGPANPELDAQVQADVPGEYPLSPDGSSYMVPKDSFPALKTAQDYHSQVSQFFSSASEAQVGAQQASDFRQMANDFMLASPEALQNWLGYWATGGQNAPPELATRHQRAFSQMAAKVPEVLSRVNPQAHQALSQKFVQSAVEAAYQKAAQSGTKEDLLSAQSIEWGLTGKYKTELPALNPQDARISEFEAREAAFNQRQAAEFQRQVGEFSTKTLEGAKFSGLRSKIDELLKPVEAKYPALALKDIKEGIHRDVISKLQSNQDWWNEHHQAYQGLIQDFQTTFQRGTPGAGLQARSQAYIQDFVSRATRALQPFVQSRLNAAMAAKKAQNGTARTAPQPPAPSRSGSNGTPSQPSGRLTPDQWDQQLRDAMTVR